MGGTTRTLIIGTSALVLMNAILTANVVRAASASLGSIKMCEIVENASGAVVNGADVPGSIFSTAGIVTLPSSPFSSAGVLPTTLFTTPLAVNMAMFGATIPNVQCVVYEDLPLGHYFYAEEQIDAPSTTWMASAYNDHDTVLVTSTASFSPYGDSSPDADGDIELTTSSPNHQLLIANTYIAPTDPAAGAPVAPTSITVAGVLPPAVTITDAPNRSTPLPFGGGDVTYSYTVKNPGGVAMHDVVVTDDTCASIFFSSGDGNNNTLLDPGEAWIYTCETHIPFTTKSVATVEGSANGLVATAQAATTVAVSVPGFPNTGFPPYSRLAL